MEPNEFEALGYITALLGYLGGEYEPDCRRVGYIIVSESPKAGSFPISCYLIGFASGIAVLLIVEGGVRVIDGLVAGFRPELVVADYQDLYDKAREYGCERIIGKLDDIKEELGVLEEIDGECKSIERARRALRG